MANFEQDYLKNILSIPGLDSTATGAPTPLLPVLQQSQKNASTKKLATQLKQKVASKKASAKPTPTKTAITTNTPSNMPQKTGYDVSIEEGGIETPFGRISTTIPMEGPDSDLDLTALEQELGQKKIAQESTIRDLLDQKVKILEGTQKIADTQLNLRPLAQLVDSWTGSNFASTYQAPQGIQQGLEQAGNIDNAIKTLRADVNNTDSEYIKYKIKTKLEEDKIQQNAFMRAMTLGLTAQGQERKDILGRLTADARVKAAGKSHFKEMRKLTAAQNDKLSGLSFISDRLKGVLSFVNQDEMRKELGSMPSLVMDQFRDMMQSKEKSGFLTKLAQSQFEKFYPNTSLLMSKIMDITQDIGKTKEGGVLRQWDEIKYAFMLPNIRNRHELFTTKLIDLTKQVRDNYRTYYDYVSSNWDVGAIPKTTEKPKTITKTKIVKVPTPTPQRTPKKLDLQSLYNAAKGR